MYEQTLNLLAGKGEGVTYVRVGNSWPYPIWCPIPERRKRAFETIRVPDNDHHGSNSNSTTIASVLGIRDRTAPHARRYNRYIDKTIGFDPIDTLHGLRIESQRMEIRTDGNKHEQQISPYHGANDVDEDGTHSIAQEHHDDSNDSDHVSGPRLTLDQDSLVYYSTPGQLSCATVRISNIGTCALQYSWTRREPIDELQAARSDGKFQLTTESKGTLLPETVKEFHFSFLTEQEGIFTDSYQLQTIPLCESVKEWVVSLRGVALLERDIKDAKDMISKGLESSIESKDLQKRDLGDLDMNNWVVEDHCNDGTVSSYSKRRYQFLHMNKDSIIPNTISSDILVLLEDISQRVIVALLNEQDSADQGQESKDGDSTSSDQTTTPGRRWDYNLESLKLMIHNVQDLDKRSRFYQLYQDVISVVGRREVPSEAVENLAQSSMESGIRYCIAYEQIMDAIEEIDKTARFLHGQIFDSDNTRKPKKDDKVDKSLANEDLLLSRYRHNLLEQTNSIVVNAIDRIEILWTESRHRIEATTKP